MTAGQLLELVHSLMPALRALDPETVLWDTGALPEPLYSVSIALAAIPCSESQLFTLLKEMGAVPRYRYAARGRRHRMVTGAEIRACRDVMVRRQPKRMRAVLTGRSVSEAQHQET